MIAMFFGSVAVAAAKATFEGPAVATTAGQSPGALMVKMIAQRAGVECEQNDMLTAADLAAGNFKTLFITMGTSGKGLGAAGIDINQDLKRITDLIAKAREMDVKIVATMFEGMARRTDQSDEMSIDTVAPFADVIMIKSDVDHDGRFTRISDAKGIPLYSFEQPLDSVPVIAELFGK